MDTMQAAVAEAFASALTEGQADRAARLALAAAEAEAEAAERAGLAMLTAEALSALDTAVERRAARHSDVDGADALSTAVQVLALAAGRAGKLPEDRKERAAMVAAAAARGVASARADARKRNGGQIRQTAAETAAEALPVNAMDEWTDDKLIARAERYTMGKLSTVGQARAVLAARRESPSLLPRVTVPTHVWRPVGRPAFVWQRAGGPVDGPVNGQTWTETTEQCPAAMVRPVRFMGRTSSPSAESDYATERRAAAAAEALAGGLSASFDRGDAVDLLMSAYVPQKLRGTRKGGRLGEVTRDRGVRWTDAAAPFGMDRGTVRYRARRAASAARCTMAAAAAPERAAGAAWRAAAEHGGPAPAAAAPFGTGGPVPLPTAAAPLGRRAAARYRRTLAARGTDGGPWLWSVGPTTCGPISSGAAVPLHATVRAAVLAAEALAAQEAAAARLAAAERADKPWLSGGGTARWHDYRAAAERAAAAVEVFLSLPMLVSALD